jgi:hypothetical protein
VSQFVGQFGDAVERLKKLERRVDALEGRPPKGA